MIGWIHVTLVLSSAALCLLIFFFLRHFCGRHPKPPQPVAGNLSVPPRRTLFSWSDNPELVSDAIENGWSRFAFTDRVSSSSSLRSNMFLLGSCGAAGGDVEISWEVCQESADFMQKIRLNSGLKKVSKTKTSSLTVVKSALPLPGPTLGNSSPFPQEAYFEITILSIYENGNGDNFNGKGRVKSGEDENIKLIQEDGGFYGRGVHGKLEESRDKSCTKEITEGRNELIVKLSVGFTGGGLLPVKLPGSYPGSVGFNSDGSIYLDGIKLVTDSTIERWEKRDTVIGCGYNPSQKKVFFTVNSKLVHEINCTGDEFETPLYPVLAANTNVIVLVNYGQSTFIYASANLQRTQNPCFIGTMASSPSLEYEDSKELFSMGIIDSQWLNRSTTRNGPYISSVNKGITKDYDESSEGDLFEIVIERNSCSKSPSTPF